MVLKTMAETITAPQDELSVGEMIWIEDVGDGVFGLFRVTGSFDDGLAVLERVDRDQLTKVIQLPEVFS